MTVVPYASDTFSPQQPNVEPFPNLNVSFLPEGGLDLTYRLGPFKRSVRLVE